LDSRERTSLIEAYSPLQEECNAAILGREAKLEAHSLNGGVCDIEEREDDYIKEGLTDVDNYGKSWQAEIRIIAIHRLSKDTGIALAYIYTIAEQALQRDGNMGAWSQIYTLVKFVSIEALWAI
jgi:hypothetical protein